jgi:5-methyltetrahydrofolate--homocysteine methyltransferase
MPKALDDLREAIVAGNVVLARSLTETMLEDKTDPLQVMSTAVTPAMQTVGKRYEDGEFFLPEMMAAAQASQSCLSLLHPLLAARGARAVATAVMGTVKGDLHDIGKNTVCMMLEGAGFDVIDLGVDVAPGAFVETIRKGGVHLVGLSALLTTTMPMMRVTIEAMERSGTRGAVKIMVGGPGVAQAYADSIGADGYAPDASAAVRKARELLGLA